MVKSMSDKNTKSLKFNMAVKCVEFIAVALVYVQLVHSLGVSEKFLQIEQLLDVQQKKIDSLTQMVLEQNEIIANKQGLISALSDTVLDQNGRLKLQEQLISELTDTVRRQEEEISDLKRKVEVLETQRYPHNDIQSWWSKFGRKISKQCCFDKDEPKKAMASVLTEHVGKRLLVGSGDLKRKVGFYAYITTNEPIGQHKVMVFSVMETNIGTGYNNHSGIFTAPFSGLYGFSCSLYPGDHSLGNFHLMKNDKEVSTIFTDSDVSNWDVSSSSVTTVLSLQQGDDVYIRSCEKSVYTNVGTIEGSKYAKSSFSGWLISE